jgi:hypothetical protein
MRWKRANQRRRREAPATRGVYLRGVDIAMWRKRLRSGIKLTIVDVRFPARGGGEERANG